MTPAIAKAVAGMATTLGKVSGTKVTYSDGTYSCNLIAIKAKALQSLDVDQARLQAQEQDWILVAAELVLNETTVFPDRGHTIDDCGQIYKVLGDGSRPSWTPHDQFGVMLRVHSKRVT